MKTDIKNTIEIPEKVEVNRGGNIIKVKGPKGEASKKLVYPNIEIKIKDKKVVLSAKKGTKREKRMIGTFTSHIKNLIEGVKKGHIYKLKICSSHFPMDVSYNNGEFIVKNFLGEKIPRKTKINEKVDIKISGEDITVESTSKELAGDAASKIEQLCRITGRDRHIFQDGIYITKKSEKISE